MLIPMKWISRLIGSDSIPLVHVGAHAAEEWETYCAYGCVPRIWIEALPEMADRLRRRFEGSPEDAVLEGAAWSAADLRLDFRLASNGQSSSLLVPTGVLTAHPNVSFAGSELVTTVTLDQAVALMRRRFGLAPAFLNLDVQGAELEVLKGLSEWTSVSWIYTEASVRELYGGQALIGDIDRFLGPLGFRRVATRILSRVGWGEALYARTDAWRNRPLSARLRFIVAARMLEMRVRLATARAAVARRVARN